MAAIAANIRPAVTRHVGITIDGALRITTTATGIGTIIASCRRMRPEMLHAAQPNLLAGCAGCASRNSTGGPCKSRRRSRLRAAQRLHERVEGFADPLFIL